MDVSQEGVRVISIPMPLADTWSFDAVPAGTFQFTVCDRPTAPGPAVRPTASR
ncbi:MAG: hypothetical protein R2712_24190 [Vicinamibacterales bacterium]